MRFTKLIPKRLFLIMVTGAVLACAGNQSGVSRHSEAKDPVRLIRLLEKDMSIARRNQVNVLSPTLFARAEAALNNARQLSSAGKNPTAVLEQINSSQSYLLKARDRSQIARAVLSQAIKNRAAARNAGAVNLGKDYARVEEDFARLTRAIESNNVRYARNNAGSVAEAFRKLEIRSIKIQTIGEVRKLLQTATEQKTDKVAPRTYEAARSKLQEVDRFISANPYNKTIIIKMANDALFLARRHIEIAQFSRRLDPMEPEQIALQLEAFMLKISGALSAPDMRDHAFKTQVDNIIGTIAARNQDRIFSGTREKELQDQIALLKLKLAELEGNGDEKQISAAKREQFNRQAKKVRELFDPRDADIYIDDLRLFIRLKSIRFPVGKSIVLPENYELLGKVQRGIRMIGDVDIIIQGHTDSTGSEKVNELLSEQRADAVRHFLVADDALSYDRIIAVGYGSMRPIASNSTKKGRAMNRRIDLIITPQL